MPHISDEADLIFSERIRSILQATHSSNPFGQRNLFQEKKTHFLKNSSKKKKIISKSIET